jgi:hypothetical protein
MRHITINPWLLGFLEQLCLLETSFSVHQHTTKYVDYNNVFGYQCFECGTAETLGSPFYYN